MTKNLNEKFLRKLVINFVFRITGIIKIFLYLKTAEQKVKYHCVQLYINALISKLIVLKSRLSV